MVLPSPAQILADLGCCLRFFSRLTIPPLSRLDDPAAAPDFSRAAALAPLAGAILALPAALAGALLATTDLPGLIVGAVAVALQVTISGALHEDGLADVADGFFGGHTPARRLEIMRDSRIGAFGALALTLALIIRVAAFAALSDLGPAAMAAGLIAAAGVSRAAMVALWHSVPPARPDGLSARYGRPDRTAALVAALSGLGIGLAATLVSAWTAWAAGIMLAFAGVLWLSRSARLRIGGQTGDVLGAAQQLGELGFLIGLLI
jgi:adenosylcobinamide-GDP ribazoletransferase